MWALGKTVLFRTTLFVGLASVVTSIIYFTAGLSQDFVSCERPCHDLEMPMICRVKLVLEPYQTMTRACRECPRNSSDCFRRHCITADGSKRGLLTANRQLPGPNIHVCENDILVVDVVNRIPGQEVAVHWRGQPLHETPFMDGVPMVTQCPIPSSTTFQYKFRATRAGTHLWHAHTGRDGDGIFGALIVRQTESSNVELDLYDVDDPDHVIVVNTWRGGVALQARRDDVGDLLLINGRSEFKSAAGVAIPGSSFTVSPGKRHRFRAANAGGRGARCPVSLSVDGHDLLVIALDGNSIAPRLTRHLQLASGERADFVLQASQANASYYLRASTSTSDGCDRRPLDALAVVRYADDVSDPTPSDADNDAGRRQLTTGFHHKCGTNKQQICIMELESIVKLPDKLRRKKMDSTFYLHFGYRDVEFNDSSSSLSWGYQEAGVPSTNNITFVFPSSPLLTQPEDVAVDLVCTPDKRPARCGVDADVCECVHVIDVPLGDSVELVLSDAGGGSVQSQVFHLHGQAFHVVGVVQSRDQLSPLEVEALDRRGALLARNLVDAVLKDTLAVPARGVAALRFVADNPGYWLLENAQTPAMNVVLRVGQPRDTPVTPENFPRCRSWVGPDFFLI